ncbi:glycosyltransferase 87 family protein [Saccharothrix xinjiangensis]|uniref:Glycosyltransferase 87 family protein n=1 Tax=Saccharothrix xinjiangensis TaxID=204798 RepID=A0ABV9Y4L5_9PSEU
MAVIAVAWWVADLPVGVDSAVYRSGARAVLRGEPLYERLAATPDWSPDLPFAYPPFAALLFLPAAGLPTQLVWGLFGVLTALALGLVVRLTGPRPGVWWLLPLTAVLEPVWRTVGLGQVNVLLMALVVVDVLALRGSRWSGVLIGVAAAVKLTPLVFVGHLLLTGRRADALRAVGAFAAAGLAGFALLPGDSWRFWGSAVLGANDALSNGWWGNQSLHGLAHRLAGVPATPLLLLAVPVCGLVAALLVRTLHGRADHLGALLVTAFCGLLVSPISWTHHWVWVVPLCCLAARRGAPLVAVATAVLFSGGVLALAPRGRELSWTPLESSAGNAYVLAALAALAVTALRAAWRAPRRGPRVAPGRRRG